MAQSSPVVAREVVQPLPPPGTDALNNALQRLAANPRDAGALVDAGFASLNVGDVDAAVGFFSRADAVDPGNARAQAGLGAAYVRSENPYDALLMFEEAEKAGVAPISLAGDRGLAYDLVGDNSSAQLYYRQALAAKSDEEVTRRLALSLAISGDKAGAEAALLPLLEKQDLAAYRARAFVLAITSDAKGAQDIVDRVMPVEMAAKMAPYLRYMPRLTPAQQAAAANFGQFPRAADIGRDDPRVAKYSGKTNRYQSAASSQSALVPSGEPLGAAGANGKSAKEAKRAKKSAEPAQTAQANLPQAASSAPAAPSGELPPVSRTGTSEVASAMPTQAGRSTGSAPTPLMSPGGETAIASYAAGPQPSASRSTPAAAPLNKPVPVEIPASTAPPATSAMAAASEPAAETAVAVAPVPTSSVPETPAAPRRIVDVFADFSQPVEPAARASGAVDITKITPRREAPPPKAEPKPKPPAHPSRNWVQVATGRDTKALGFDWRRISRGEAKLFKGRDAYIASWGRTNRLLTGPFPNEGAAQAFVTDLKKAGVDAFTFTSDEGEEVKELKSAR
ncbi:tetratricopeptide repeat protein [Croceicoccus estronivorus]|uniref:tetratricopeptide repeat protein n=1 Tax=Croceicoccus estronivorus TaxID=1172626 RepID=UPI001478880E|nr:hypothetical protein [Croceicoccus estronivorus]